MLLRACLSGLQLNEKRLELVGSKKRLVKCKNVVWQPAFKTAG
jgi:hypothetical protein